MERGREGLAVSGEELRGAVFFLEKFFDGSWESEEVSLSQRDIEFFEHIDLIFGFDFFDNECDSCAVEGFFDILGMEGV